MHPAGVFILGIVTGGLVTADLLLTDASIQPQTSQILNQQEDPVTSSLPSSQEGSQLALLDQPVPDTQKSSPDANEPTPAAQKPASQEAAEKKPPTFGEEVSAQICSEQSDAETRTACYNKHFAEITLEDGSRKTLAIIDDWRVNTRRRENDTSGRVIIRTQNTQSKNPAGNRLAVRHIYAACRQGKHTFWVDFDKAFQGRTRNIPVEVSFDDAPYSTVYMNASKRKTALGIWSDQKAADFMKRLADTKEVKIRPVHDSIAQSPAIIQTSNIEKVLEPLKIACR